MNSKLNGISGGSEIFFGPRVKNLDETWELDMPKELLQLVIYPPKNVMVGCG